MADVKEKKDLFLIWVFRPMSLTIVGGLRVGRETAPRKEGPEAADPKMGPRNLSRAQIKTAAVAPTDGAGRRADTLRPWNFERREQTEGPDA